MFENPWPRGHKSSPRIAETPKTSSLYLPFLKMKSQPLSPFKVTLQLLYPLSILKMPVWTHPPVQLDQEAKVLFFIMYDSWDSMGIDFDYIINFF